MKTFSSELTQPDFVQPPPERVPPLRGVLSSGDLSNFIPPPLTLRPSKEQLQIENLATNSQRVPPPWSTAVEPPWSTATRPLSDIRELTEPSLADVGNYDSGYGRKSHLSREGSLGRKTSHRQKNSLSRNPSLGRRGSHRTIDKATIKPLVGDRAKLVFINPHRPSSPSSQEPSSSPPSPVRLKGSSSDLRHHNRRPSVRHAEDSALTAVPPRGEGYTIANYGRARSPVKGISPQQEIQSNEPLRRIPSRTFIRPSEYPNLDILDFPCHRHPRVSADLQLNAALFVGGSTIEGQIKFCVEDIERIRHRRQLAVARVSVDLLGIEEMSGARRHVFLNLATELIDVANPPPAGMVETKTQLSPIDPFWALVPSVTHLPFAISLPLDTGPPPFHSKHSRIRYVLSVTSLVRDQGRQYLVRSSQAVSVLPVYDPEKALISLPSPLTASDMYMRQTTTGEETVKVTAGLHRQVWVSGTTIFIDVYIENNSKKGIKRVELQLERDILCYKHAAASTMEKSASQARLFDSNERATLAKATFKPGAHGWTGVSGHSSDIRTFDLELPRGHATVRCGKFFEVRYFVNVVVSSSHTKLVTVQLPIILIHMNSLDVVPNSVAQVAAAIEKKRSQRSASRAGRSSPFRSRRSTSISSVQGRAFAAPRKQSSEQRRAEAEEINTLCKLLYDSPRKYANTPPRYPTRPPKLHDQPSKSSLFRIGSSRPASKAQDNANQSPASSFFNYTYATPPSNRKGRVIASEFGSDIKDVRDRLRRMRSTDTNGGAHVAPGEVVPPPPPPKDHVHGPASKGVNFSFWGISPSRGIGNRAQHHYQELDASPILGSSSRPGSALDSKNSATRPFHFRKMKSIERWRGTAGGWFVGAEGDGTKTQGDRGKEPRDSSWI